MKKIMNIFLCVLAISIIFNTINIFAEENMNTGTLYVNNEKVENESIVIFENDSVLIPLRSTFEKLGAQVNWNSENNNIEIKYLKQTYICEFHSIGDSYRSITIKNDNLNNGSLGPYIQLNPMSGSGAYKMINDRTYLYQDTGKRLFEALGCKVEIDLEQNKLSISNQ